MLINDIIQEEEVRVALAFSGSFKSKQPLLNQTYLSKAKPFLESPQLSLVSQLKISIHSRKFRLFKQMTYRFEIKHPILQIR